MHTSHFKIEITLDGHCIEAMIDSGATGLFISERVVEELQLPIQDKQEPYNISVVDGSLLSSNDGRVNKETTILPAVVGQHYERLTFDVIRMANHDIVLGIPWLRRHNPTIDWKQHKLRFDGCSCMENNSPMKKRFNIDEDLNEICEVSYPNKKLGNSFDSIDTELSQLDQHKIRDTRGIHAPPAIPQEYKQWLHLFADEVTAKALPKHKPWDHEIKLEPGKQPTFRPIYALSSKELQELRKYLDENLRKGFIRKSESPAGYPILFVPKKDGSLRLCVDYRALNNITIKNRYPLPNIGELQDRLIGAKWFTALDLRGAYNLIRMKEGEEWKTAFRTRLGHYEYTVMPFGLTNAPATCQSMVNDALRPLLDSCVVAYLDDILVYSKTKEEHVQHVKRVLELLKSYELKLKPEKCEFHKQEVPFLGFIVGIKGIKMDPNKIESLRAWPIPTNVKEVQAFLGFANYNRRFIKDYSKIATALNKLTKKEQPFEWKQEQQQAFQKLIDACTSEPLLKTFDPDKAVILETDASDLAIGACLTQNHDGKRHPVAYYSRSLSPAEQNYDVHDKELLAIVASLKHWRVYTEGALSLDIYTDHKNLLYFTTTKELNRRQVRWSEELGQYKFTIKYTPGKDNGRADALSRRTDYMNKEPINHSILKVNKDGSISRNTHEINATMIIMDDEQEQFPISKGKLQVTRSHITDVIRKHHDGPLQGHPGITKTIQSISRNYSFPKMKEEVTKYIAACAPCQKNKPDRHKLQGEIQMIPPPSEPWEEVTMDFITKLPKSQDPATLVNYDSILVVVDRLTKYSHFIPFKESYNAEQLTYVIIDRILRIRGIPKSYITDRDKLFTSRYWKTITSMMGTKHKLSTAYHPQTDGQTERSNQTLEVYLRHFVNDKQDNWITLLPLAELAINNQRSSTTGISPNEANYGRLLHVRREPIYKTEASESAIQRMNKINETTRAIEQTIAKRNKETTVRENKKRVKGPQLKEGDKVYLRTKNLKTRKTSKKLDNVKVGPFIIKKVKGPVSYELQLPADAKVHPVFHASLLEPADPNTPLQKKFHYQVEEEDVFEVEKILEEKPDQYLVKWKGYPNSENTWEPKQNIQHCEEKIQEFQQLRLYPNQRYKTTAKDRARK